MTQPIDQVPACGTQNLTKVFGSGEQPVVAVDNVSVAIARGTFVTVKVTDPPTES